MNTLARLREIRSEYQEAERERRRAAYDEQETIHRRWMAAALGCDMDEVPGAYIQGMCQNHWEIGIGKGVALRFEVLAEKVRARLETLGRNGWKVKDQAVASRTAQPREALGYLLTVLGADLEGGSQ